MRDMNAQSPPVREGDEFDVTIEAVGEKGDGIAKKDGFVLFVARTQQGDRKRVRVTKVLTNVGFAEVVGDASKGTPSRAERERPVKKKEPEEEFDPKPELDSEDFGEEEK